MRLMRISCASALLAAICSMATANAGTTGGVCGHVLAENGQPVAGALVTAEAPSADESRVADSTGWYCFMSLPPDHYALVYRRAGWNPVSLPTDVHANQQIRVDATLMGNGSHFGGRARSRPRIFWDAASYWPAEIEMLAPLAASPDSIAGALRATASVQLGSVPARP
jgi:hypothetical protein